MENDIFISAKILNRTDCNSVRYAVKSALLSYLTDSQLLKSTTLDIRYMCNEIKTMPMTMMMMTTMMMMMPSCFTSTDYSKK